MGRIHQSFRTRQAISFFRETVTIVDNLGLMDRQKGNAKQIFTAIQRYVEGQIKESVEIRNFHCHVQQTGETFDDILVSLHELAKTCNFCSDQCTQNSIRDQIIEGLLDGDTVEDLLKEKDLTLEKQSPHATPRKVQKDSGQKLISCDLTEPAIQTIRRSRPAHTSISTSVPRLWWWISPRRPEIVPRLELDMSHMQTYQPSSIGMQGIEIITPSTITTINHGCSTHTPS